MLVELPYLTSAGSREGCSEQEVLSSEELPVEILAALRKYPASFLSGTEEGTCE